MVERAFYAAVKRLMTDPIDGLLMAVSGGVDSMVMAHLLLRWIETPEGSRICSRTAIAHMNFSLREKKVTRIVILWNHGQKRIIFLFSGKRY